MRPDATRPRRRRGFSLLEVLMAVALFGAVVTIILSAQAGLVASDRTATNISQAIELGRCRMSEIEEKQLKLGFPEVEEKDQSPICCNEKENPGFSCEWKVERVLLPQPMALGGDGGLGSILGGGLGLGLEGGVPGSGMLSTGVGNMAVNPMGGASLDFDAGLQNLGAGLQQSFGGAGMSGLLSLVFSLVYPSLKPMLEAAIRRVTVIVHWHEGKEDRDFTLQQYITNPSRAGLLGALADAGAAGEGGGLPINTGAGGAATAPPPMMQIGGGR
jgi:general secretion pathway protein I